MRKKRTSNALKGIASCMICAWSLCACGNVAEDSSDRKVMEESKAAEYEALFDEIEAITPYKSLSNTNPIMTQRFGADPYAMVYKDRVYFYMTGDTFEYDAELTKKRRAKVEQMKKEFEQLFNQKYDNTSYYIENGDLVVRLNVSNDALEAANWTKGRRFIVEV